jgi:large subunit ribosomal protein L21
MYAIIRAGGKQSKVQSGDVLDIERVKGDETELTFEPLLVVDDDGTAVSDQKALAKASVQAKILGESHGPKVDIFKYKNKTGYRRRQGHRQKYTRIEITDITLPGAKKASSAKKAESSDKAADAKKTTAKAASSAKTATAKTATAKKATSKATSSAKPTTAKKPASKGGSSAKAGSTKKAASGTKAASSKKPASAKKSEAAKSEEE